MFGRGRQAEDPLVPRDTDRAVFKLDDDRRRGVVGWDALGGGGRILVPGLVGATRLLGTELDVDGRGGGSGARLAFLATVGAKAAGVVTAVMARVPAVSSTNAEVLRWDIYGSLV